MPRSARAWWPGGRATTNPTPDAPAPARKAAARGQPDSGGQQGGGDGVGRHVGVGVEPALAHGVEMRHVAGVVDALDRRVGGGLRRHGDEVCAEVEVVDAPEHGADAGGPLGVALDLVLRPADGSRDDEHDRAVQASDEMPPSTGMTAPVR